MKVKRMGKKRELQELQEEIDKRKAELLLLNKKPTKKLEWPWMYQPKAQKPCFIKDEPKNLYRKQSLKALQKNAPVYYFTKSLPEVQAKTNNELDELVGKMLNQDMKDVDKSKTESVQALSLSLLDRMFTSLADISIPVPETTKADIGWEYVMGNMLKLGLPQTVIDRVKKRMEETGVEPSPAITAMNVTRPLLSDLTITTAEVEMQEEIKKLVAEKELFESKPGDELFQDSVKWLIELDRKDQYFKDKEIEQIHLDYTKLL